jgi:4-aminobutyrate aminotransferase-like enzyme
MAMDVSDLTPQATPAVATRYRRICTPIPVPESIERIKRLRAVEPRSMAGMPPIIWHQAEGYLIRDPYGNQWIDLTSGIVVANVGHAHPRILEAIRKQLDAKLVFSYAFPTEIRRQLLERLVALAPPGLNKAIVFSSGTEATECAMSLMRKHGLSLSPSKLGILSIESAYHGRTLSAKLAGSAPGLVDGLNRESVFHTQLPLPGSAESHGFLADLAARSLKPETIAGIIFESIPGWTTTLYPPPYVKELMDWAARNEVLVTADEVQTGMGRTGKLFAFEHYGITPDLIACGKGLSSSLPVSAVIGREPVMELASPGEMSSTFGGSPVCLAAALANLDVIEEERLVERSATLGMVLGKALEVIAERHRAHVRSLQGRGLFYSLHLKDPTTGEALREQTDAIALACVRRGVMLFVTGRGFIKVVPPLTIDREALLEAVETIGAVIDETLRS